MQENPIDLKLVDPTYQIRAVPSGSQDRVLCKILGQTAVHAAFAGFTDITVGPINTHFAFLPIPTGARPRDSQ
jgi:6-phosphofructokinase 1